MSSVKRRLTPKRERETPEYAAMVRRIIRAHGRRVIHADPEDLAELVALRTVVDQAITEAVQGMRAEHGRSWSEIGRGLGTSRQAAQMRYGGVQDGTPPRQGDADLPGRASHDTPAACQGG